MKRHEKKSKKRRQIVEAKYRKRLQRSHWPGNHETWTTIGGLDCLRTTSEES